MKFLTLLLVTFSLPLVASEGKFSNQSELSSIQTGGNSKVETYNLKTLTNYILKKNSYEFGGHYTLGTSEDTETGESTESARNWDVYVKYTRDLHKRLSVYTKFQIESNKFAGYNQRDNYDVGAKYSMINTDTKVFFVELGYRYTVEKNTQRDEDGEDQFKYNKGRFYTEYSNKLNESVSLKMWIEYLPNFTEAEKYLASFEPSFVVLLNDTFSLKLAYKGSYNNDPGRNDAGERFEYLDYVTTSSLIAQF